MPCLLAVAATSEIAVACLRRFAKEGWELILAGRDRAALSALESELRAEFPRCPALSFHAYDVTQSAETQEAFWQSVSSRVDAVLVAVGALDDGISRYDGALAQRLTEVNYTGLLPLLNAVALSFEERGRGTLMVISSVAGLRGRASNYVYGAAKAALNAYLEGLRQRVERKGVRVMTILPGLIDTRMVAFKSLPGWGVGTTQEVARDVYRAFLKGRRVVYSPWYYRYVMALVRALPRSLYVRFKHW